MKTVSIDIGTVKEWKAKDINVYKKILERFSDINTDTEWYKYTIDEFIKRMEGEGVQIETKDVQFSGFSSQGDGASFTGKVSWKYIADCIKRHNISIPKIAKWTRLASANMDTSWASPLYGIVSRISSHYCHCNTVSLSLEYDDTDLSTKLCEYIGDTLYDMKGELKDLDTFIETELKDEMKDLYRELESEYESLSSEEAIVDTLETNEYLFDADGIVRG